MPEERLDDRTRRHIASHLKNHAAKYAALEALIDRAAARVGTAQELAALWLHLCEICRHVRSLVALRRMST